MAQLFPACWAAQKSGQVADPTALPAKGSSGPPLLRSGLVTHRQGRYLLPFFLCSALLSSAQLLGCDPLHWTAEPARCAEQVVHRDVGGL